MKRFLLSFILVLASAGYVLYLYSGGSVASAATPETTTPTQTTPTTAPPASAPRSAPPTPTPTTTAAPSGQYVDGTYAGSPYDAYYGTVQVRAVVSGGKLASVNFLQYPNDRDTSRYINSQAMPLLSQEAIQAQSANVSGVSGASDTSAAFIESLASALVKAKNS